MSGQYLCTVNCLPRESLYTPLNIMLLAFNQRCETLRDLKCLKKPSHYNGEVFKLEPLGTLKTSSDTALKDCTADRWMEEDWLCASPVIGARAAHADFLLDRSYSMFANRVAGHRLDHPFSRTHGGS